MNQKQLASLLGAPFAPYDVEWRAARAGMSNGKPWIKVLAYITARAIQHRLDDVVGPMNWKVEHQVHTAGGFLCTLSLWDEDKKEWVGKTDGAGNTESKADEDDIGFALKGGMSGALKRAGALWGIGRYLYDLEEGFAIVREGGKHRQRIENTWYSWDPPDLPAWALPGRPSDSPATGSEPLPPPEQGEAPAKSKGKGKAAPKETPPPAANPADAVDTSPILAAFGEYAVTKDNLEDLLGKPATTWKASDINVLRHYFKQMKNGDLDTGDLLKVAADAKAERASAGK